MAGVIKIYLEVERVFLKTTVVLAAFQRVEEKEHSLMLPTAGEDQDDGLALSLSILYLMLQEFVSSPFCSVGTGTISGPS